MHAWGRQLWGTIGHVPPRLPFNFFGHFRATQTPSLFHWTLRGRLPGQKIYKNIVTVYCMNGCQHKIIFS